MGKPLNSPSRPPLALRRCRPAGSSSFSEACSRPGSSKWRRLTNSGPATLQFEKSSPPSNAFPRSSPRPGSNENFPRLSTRSKSSPGNARRRPRGRARTRRTAPKLSAGRQARQTVRSVRCPRLDHRRNGHRERGVRQIDPLFQHACGEPLLYRLNTAEIHLPPLRDRKEDVPLLAQQFLADFCRVHGKSLAFDPKVLALLQEYEWAGNVRLLKHVVQRVAIACPDGTITTSALTLAKPKSRKAGPSTTPLVSIGDTPLNLPQIIEDWEKDMMEQAIHRFQDNRSAAARHLGFEAATFRKKCRKYFGRKT